VERYEVRLPGLPGELDGTVVIGLSDLHLGSLIGEPWLSARIDQVQAERPDLVVLLGDLFEGHGLSPDDLLDTFGRLAPPLGVWCVPGNHEARTSMQLMENAGYEVLRNEWKEVKPGLVLSGITAGRRSGEANIARALADRPPGAVILLAHRPQNAEEAAAAGADLMLSGHTHGGQIWPFGYLVRFSTPLVAGRYEVDGMTVIVSRGAGTWGPRMRLWPPGEILRITLRKAEEPVVR
jgi:predicted MPP superfamily phosphohydrolase